MHVSRRSHNVFLFLKTYPRFLKGFVDIAFIMSSLLVDIRKWLIKCLWVKPLKPPSFSIPEGTLADTERPPKES